MEPLIIAKCIWSKLHGLALLAIDQFFNQKGEELQQYLTLQIVLTIRGLQQHPSHFDTDDPTPMTLKKIYGNHQSPD